MATNSDSGNVEYVYGDDRSSYSVYDTIRRTVIGCNWAAWMMGRFEKLRFIL